MAHYIAGQGGGFADVKGGGKKEAGHNG